MQFKNYGLVLSKSRYAFKEKNAEGVETARTIAGGSVYILLPSGAANEENRQGVLPTEFKGVDYSVFDSLPQLPCIAQVTCRLDTRKNDRGVLESKLALVEVDGSTAIAVDLDKAFGMLRAASAEQATEQPNGSSRSRAGAGA